ncbi:phage head closure protein [Polycladomyces sp. WAk]|uniref:Phage head closure protein n=1 Tax=Polycladomyces zharkentensis TaxID=2807616 RepID=A0ABS2WI01_9BACL|nr:phage head closure protein [Polycladomyces sp. WAk]MBN2909153.1 phage head closure protein [Polycladomyces sp. WAk]
MRINDLRHRVTLQKKNVIKDSEGLVTETWIDVATVWAAVEPLRGREYFEAAVVNAENIVRIRMRYRDGVKPDMRVIYSGRIFNITSVIDIDERHREMHLMCREVTAG